MNIHWHSVGGCTISKLRQFDLNEIIRFRPDLVFLQVGTNNLTQRGMTTTTVGLAIEDFIRLLHDEHSFSFVCVGQTIKCMSVGNFNSNVEVLAQYLKVVLEPLPFAVYWTYRVFWRPAILIKYTFAVYKQVLMVILLKYYFQLFNRLLLSYSITKENLVVHNMSFDKYFCLQKRLQRLKVLTDSTSFIDDKQRIKEVLTNSFLPPDESMTDSSDRENDVSSCSEQEEAAQLLKKKIIGTKKLSWRSTLLNDVMAKLDKS